MSSSNDGSDFALAYALARVGFGINLFAHGLSRIGTVPAFAESLRNMFSKTWLPPPLVTAAGFTIPPLEFVIGTLIILGLLLRPGADCRNAAHVGADFRQLPAPTMVGRRRAANLHGVLRRTYRMGPIQPFLTRHVAQAVEAAQLIAVYSFLQLSRISELPLFRIKTSC
jgi:DoxX-like protein